MIVKTYKRITEIEHIWNKLYKSSLEMSFFQSYEWNLAAEMNFFRKKEQFKGRKLIYMVFEESLIMPLVVDYIKKEISILGQDESSDYLSFIYQVFNPDDVVNAINYVLDKYSEYKLILDKINQNNLLTKYIQRGIDSVTVIENRKDCVYIPTKRENSSFYESLSKGTRQNYRTAKNRLKNDGHTYQVRIEDGKISQEKAQRLYDLYRARRNDCDSRNELYKTVSRTLKMLAEIVLSRKPIDLLSYYAQHESVFLSGIYIDGELAAFCEGSYNNRNDVISIARVATNSKYYTYSPGQILLIDTIESVKNDVAYFDLTRGSEDYKFKLGGIAHSNRCFILKRRRK